MKCRLCGVAENDINFMVKVNKPICTWCLQAAFDEAVSIGVALPEPRDRPIQISWMSRPVGK